MEDKGFLFGLDLGQSNDPTACTILQRFREPSVLRSDDEYGRQLQLERKIQLDRAARGDRLPVVDFSALVKDQKRPHHYHLRHAQRWPTGTPYTQIVTDVQAMLNSAELQGRSKLVIDRTGVGRAVADMFEDLGVDFVGITITGGNEPNWGGRHHSVPKKDLAGVLQATLGTGRLKFADDVPDREVLRRELQNFEVRINTKGNATYAADWRTGTHDDIVLSLACALWYGENIRELDPDAFQPIKR